MIANMRAQPVKGGRGHAIKTPLNGVNVYVAAKANGLRYLSKEPADTPNTNKNHIVALVVYEGK